MYVYFPGSFEYYMAHNHFSRRSIFHYTSPSFSFVFLQLALLCVVLSFLGWVIFAAGFGAQIRG